MFSAFFSPQCDLLEDTSTQSKHHSKICQQYGFQGWMQTSAKEDVNVNESMNMLLRQASLNGSWVAKVMSYKPKKRSSCSDAEGRNRYTKLSFIVYYYNLPLEKIPRYR